MPKFARLENRTPKRSCGGLDLYLNDEFDQEWLLWAKQRSFYNNWCDRNYDEKGNFMLSASNPYMALRMDRKKAEEYLGPL